MSENILLISGIEKDEKRFKDLLGRNQYDITRIPCNGNLEEAIGEDRITLILADIDQIRERIDLFYSLQESRSKACLIFYGNNIDSEELNRILHRGIYAFIPRKLLSQRLAETVLGGLENRRAFIEILNMMDDLKVLNKRLEIEKDALKKRNQELSFINRLSSEISYDVNWDRILQRMMDTGLDRTLDYRLFGLLFKMGPNWRLTLHMNEPANISTRDELVSDIIHRVNRDFDQKISGTLTDFEIIPGNSGPFNRNNIDIIPLNLAGNTLGFILHEGGGSKQKGDESAVLINTLSNMLSLSLKNAQEYFRLKEASVTDGLTGVYNRKGLNDFLEKELSRAVRYKKSMSFILTDLDDFKGINDTMGHQAGDYVLQELAGILKNSFRQPDIVSRFGGDEFSILLPETELSDAHSIMIRVMEGLAEHTFRWGSDRFGVNMSYGISNSKELKEQHNSEELIRLADSRLYLDKTR